MNNSYVMRLIRIGIPIHDAYKIIFDFIKNFGTKGLEEYISDLERNAYVGRI